jgi:hypothetical protein
MDDPTMDVSLNYRDMQDGRLKEVFGSAVMIEGGTEISTWHPNQEGWWAFADRKPTDKDWRVVPGTNNRCELRNVFVEDSGSGDVHARFYRKDDETSFYLSGAELEVSIKLGDPEPGTDALRMLSLEMTQADLSRDPLVPVWDPRSGRWRVQEREFYDGVVIAPLTFFDAVGNLPVIVVPGLRSRLSPLAV